MRSPRQIGDNLWLVDGPVVRWFTMPFPTRMVLCRLGSGELFVHSPIELTAQLEAFVGTLGEPRYLVSPNKLHHLFLRQWQEAYPQARLFAPPGLEQKRPDLDFHAALGDRPDPAWEQDLDQVIFQGSRVLDEVVFLHRTTRTLILGDLIENFDPQTLSWFHRLLGRLGRVLAPHGQTPLDYRQSFRGRHALAQDSLRRLLAWQPQAVIMCHGLPVFDNATQFVERAFAWLEETDPPAGAGDTERAADLR